MLLQNVFYAAEFNTCVSFKRLSAIRVVTFVYPKVMHLHVTALPNVTNPTTHVTDQFTRVIYTYLKLHILFPTAVVIWYVNQIQ